METRTRARPTLEPVQTKLLHHGSPGSPRRRPSIFEPALRSHCLPSPLHSSTPGLDQGMRRHERAMLDSLDQRRPSQARKDSAHLLPPIPEQSPPSRERPYDAYSPPPTLAARTRNHLLYGLSDSHLSPTSTHAGIGRRQSMPTGVPSALPTSIPSAALPSPVRVVHQQLGIGRQKAQELHGRHIFQGCFVKAVDLRKFSESSASGDNTAPQEVVMDDMGQKLRYAARAWSPGKPEGRHFIKYFSQAELRKAIPKDAPEPLVVPRHATDHPSPRRASLSTSQKRRLDKEHRRSSAPMQSADPWSEMTLPIHYHLARYFFPLVAVYLQSGNVEPEDILELPMPHPKAWYQTFRYACTEQGELTDAIRENIKHLGGRV
ncbi:hypothetical protein NEUTE1DRAFT_90117 [Neurospora tetrasperma FGSC 2508]|uniref:Uncharacterized protein n=1 Tax=Neurospora tetrasperma (strain FGSC 2508 / ATCC MYA-4615 / P0657) TaxID=510951 RepID=F8N0A6_NEUT8|nr:uncharacterized protein NEUTE1DRAFT_90117 [Neurospora tetrasperma FGSC 2508]EGO52137.1 hypothetical protein NEUTE1DRAFT_90117 [Neurospora tetrasperma FGSC 2508]